MVTEGRSDWKGGGGWFLGGAGNVQFLDLYTFLSVTLQ